MRGKIGEMEEEEGSSDQHREGEAVRLEKFLPKGSLRVLLIEGDDSTRQIITALLRKCNYKVAALSDGKKAWEMLKERPHSVDVILTEADVPLISGISLLTMIMDHETLKNIPVIMMSSQDSINMVFNCMLKGAVDFLLKPIRKNELSNLWQHVWRRKTSMEAKQKLEDNSERVNQLNGFKPSVQKKEERSEKGSDAESSCTRSDMEAESAYKQYSQEPKQPISRDFRQQIQPIRPSMVHKGKAEEVSPLDATCISSEQLADDERSCAPLETTNEDVKPTESMYDSKSTNEMEIENCDQDARVKQVINLIGRIDDQREFSFGDARKYVTDAPEAVSANQSSMPMLELSLRRYSSIDELEKTERNTLNHSDSSAFSLYSSKMPMTYSSTTANFQPEFQNFSCSSPKQIADDNIPRYSSAVKQLITDDVKSSSPCAPAQDGVIKCSPLRVVPVTLPLERNNVHRSLYNTNSSDFPLWSIMSSSMPHEAFHTKSSHQSDSRDYTSSQSDQSHNQSTKSPVIPYAQMSDANVEQRDEPQQVEWIYSTNNVNISTASVSQATEAQNQEDQQQATLHHLSAREVALNKFRLKRKERCFEKKVRYQSRKRLAEQRPRVKGQFVRHIQPEAHSTEPAAG